MAGRIRWPNLILYVLDDVYIFLSRIDPTVYDFQIGGRRAKILGWGGTDGSSLMPSCDLLEANIKVGHLSISDNQCSGAL